MSNTVPEIILEITEETQPNPDISKITYSYHLFHSYPNH